MLVNFFLLIYLLSGSVDVNTSDKKPSHQELLEQGIAAFYNSEWNTAQNTFDLLISEKPNDTTIHFFDSMIPFWKYFFGGGNPADAKEFLEKSDVAIKLSERHLRKAPRDTSTVLLLSGLYGYRSLVAASEREYRIAVRSGMTGFTYTRQLLALNSDDPNAQIGSGVFNYMMGSIPKEIRWATSFAGMSGDRELGIIQLRSAAESDSHVSIDALMILTYLYFRDGEFEQAYKTADKLVERHPRNIIFQYYLGKTAAETGRKSIAAKSFRNVIDSGNQDLPHLYEDAKKWLEDLASLY